MSLLMYLWRKKTRHSLTRKWVLNDWLSFERDLTNLYADLRRKTSAWAHNVFFARADRSVIYLSRLRQFAFINPASLIASLSLFRVKFVDLYLFCYATFYFPRHLTRREY